MEINVLTGTMIETNNYIVIDNDNVVLVEASADINYIKELIAGRKVLAILLTHGHWDHYINLDKYLAEFKCKVYMTKSAFFKIQSKGKAFYADKNPKIDLDLSQVKFIEDGEDLEFGGELNFKIIASPGHTDCSICYLTTAGSDNLLFSGDTIFNNGVGRDDLPTGNRQELKNSLKKIISILPKGTVILTGHGDPTTIESEQEQLNAFIE